MSQAIQKSILVLVGSLRRNSYNRGLANAFLQSQQFKNSKVKAIVPDLGKIPFYNQDYEDDKNVPAIVNELSKQCVQASLLLFVTPQYNACVTPPLKNAYDWLSRPSPVYENKVPAFGKKAAAMSTSYVSQQQIQDCFKMGVYRKLSFFPQPYYANIASKVFDAESGKLTDKKEQQKVIKWGRQLIDFILSETKPN